MKAGFIILFCLMSMIGYATIRTVSNHPSTLAQFNTIQAAINASITGDSVLVHGSPNIYSSFNIVNKRIVLLGPGWAPMVTPSLIAVVSTTSVQLNGAGTSNSEIHGFVFTGQVNVQGGVIPTGLKFYRNEFRTLTRFDLESGLYAGYIFQGNYFNGGTLNGSVNHTYENWVLENNLFKISGTQISGFALGNTLNFLFNHNLFMNVASGAQGLFSLCGGFMFTNNIFVKKDATNVSFSTFNNNITWQTSNNTPWIGNNNIDGGGNVSNQNPLMVDQVAVDAGSAVATNNFTIASGPANDSGSDGKDMGLLFDPTGALNWANSRNARMPSVFSMLITNPVLGAGGTLNVSVSARKNE